MNILKMIITAMCTESVNNNNELIYLSTFISNLNNPFSSKREMSGSYHAYFKRVIKSPYALSFN